MTYRNCLFMTIILMASIWMLSCGESTSDESENKEGDATGDADADADNEEAGDDDSTADEGGDDVDAGDNSSSEDEGDAGDADDGDADDGDADDADSGADDASDDDADDASGDDQTDNTDNTGKDDDDADADDETDDSSVDDSTADDSADDNGDAGDGDGDDAEENDDSDDADDTPVGEDTEEDAVDDSSDDGDGDDVIDTDGDDGGDVTSTGECSATASEGLAVGDLVPNVALQRCDGTPVTLQELVCGQAALTHVYSFTEMCPGCTGFMGLEGGMDMGSMTAESLYEDYHDKGYELLVIYSGTEDFMNSEPTAADCQELEDQIVGTLVFDSTGMKTQEELDLPLKGGSALAGSDGTWVTAPPGKDASAEEGGLGDVYMTLMTELGGGFGGMGGGGMGGGK